MMKTTWHLTPHLSWGPVAPQNLPEPYRALLREYEDIFVDALPKDLTKVSTLPLMDVHIKDSFTRITSCRVPRTPLHWRSEAAKEMQKLIDQGIVEKFTGTPKCISPVQWVKKPRSTEDNLRLRLVMDLRRLNKMVERRLAMLPTVWDTLRNLNPDSTVFAVQDLLHSYFQV